MCPLTMSRLSSGPRKNTGHFSQPYIFVQSAFLQAHSGADPAHLKPIKRHIAQIPRHRNSPAQLQPHRPTVNKGPIFQTGMPAAPGKIRGTGATHGTPLSPFTHIRHSGQQHHGHATEYRQERPSNGHGSPPSTEQRDTGEAESPREARDNTAARVTADTTERREPRGKSKRAARDCSGA